MTSKFQSPLVDYPDLINTLSSGPLSSEETCHLSYLEENLSGDVLLVIDDDQQAKRLEKLCNSLNNVSNTTTRINPGIKADEVAQYNLQLPDGKEFDTIFYRKEKAGWCARSPDFHQLTDKLRTGGTLISKTKWLPRSNRLTLQEIAIAYPFDFNFPHVYVRHEKTLSTLSHFNQEKPEEHNNQTNSDPTTNLKDIDNLRSQFTYNSEKTKYSTGWSWHTKLKTWAKNQLSDFDTVANLCCGTNPIGDIRVDMAKEFSSQGDNGKKSLNCQADATTLPIKSNSVDAVITDPPWKIPLEKRISLFSEAVRITKPNGVVLQNSWWLPIHPYAVPVAIHATTANVKDYSINGPGGISFFSRYSVKEIPEIGEHTYKLEDHHRQQTLEQIKAGVKNQKVPAWESPYQDPRIVSRSATTQCIQCGSSHLNLVKGHGGPLYECLNCEFRHLQDELLSQSQKPTEDDKASQQSRSVPELIPLLPRVDYPEQTEESVGCF